MAATATGDRLTIGALAQAAGVGVETVRYYQRRGLLAVPARGGGAVRYYGRADAARIGFIKRAQALGFTLEEVRGLLALQDGTDRRSIRRIAAERLAQIRAHLRDLRKMERALAAVLADCEHHPQAPCCPIVASIAGPTAP
ncbi:MAG: MerR family transcriptional regulator [Burkholderiales bacterium]|jgi:Hg(II)-responsive transcriptional regulator|nr:MerR family transcriptional regulator [Burkholderiales bacterium]